MEKDTKCEKNWKKLGNIANIVTIIGFCISVVAFGFAYIQYNLYQEDKQMQFDTTLILGNYEFTNGDPGRAYILFLEAKRLDPKNTNTEGYELFFEKAKKDTTDRVKWLKMARELHPTPLQNAANDELNKILTDENNSKTN
jgi:hypothetical protein